MPLYYLSFCAPVGWQGAAFVEGENVISASKWADEEGINPGGKEIQVLAFQYDNLAGVPPVPTKMRNRRLDRDELLKFWPDAGDLLDYEDHV
jgi:hypothetical protein